MLSTILFCLGITLILTDTTKAASVGDFKDIEGDFEFIFHADYNLLLAVHTQGCYFVSINDTYYNRLTAENRKQAEDVLKNVIVNNVTQVEGFELQVEPTTHEKTREVFHDLLADYECKDKNVFVIFPKELPTTSSPPGHGDNNNNEDHGSHLLPSWNELFSAAANPLKWWCLPWCA